MATRLTGDLGLSTASVHIHAARPARFPYSIPPARRATSVLRSLDSSNWAGVGSTRSPPIFARALPPSRPHLPSTSGASPHRPMPRRHTSVTAVSPCGS